MKYQLYEIIMNVSKNVLDVFQTKSYPKPLNLWNIFWITWPIIILLSSIKIFNQARFHVQLFFIKQKVITVGFITIKQNASRGIK